MKVDWQSSAVSVTKQAERKLITPIASIREPRGRQPISLPKTADDCRSIFQAEPASEDLSCLAGFDNSLVTVRRGI